jgi:ElaB/YqjD/DUF883 family membrane-anchored ribosome-binding protein
MQTRSREEIEESTERLLQDLKVVVHDGEELLQATAENLNDRALAAREKLAAALETAKDMRQKLEDQVVAGAQATNQLIRDNPYRALGIAFGVGMLVGILLNRR